MLQSKIYANKAKMEPTCMHLCAGADWSRNEFNSILSKEPSESDFSSIHTHTVHMERVAYTKNSNTAVT